MPERAEASLTPAAGDYVVVRASILPSGQRECSDTVGWAVIEWGAFRAGDLLVPHLDVDDARAHARVAAAARGRTAWDTTEPSLARLPRAPLVSRTQTGTYTIRTEMNGNGAAHGPSLWSNVSGLSEPEARERLLTLGFPGAYGLVLLASGTTQRVGS